MHTRRGRIGFSVAHRLAWALGIAMDVAWVIILVDREYDLGSSVSHAPRKSGSLTVGPVPVQQSQSLADE